MPRQVISGAENLDEFVKETSVIGCGAQGIIELDSVDMTVCKRFQSINAKESAELAQREFMYLNRFSALLPPSSFLRCPEAVSVEPEQGTVRMTYCPGVSLERLLEDASDTIAEHLDHIAQQIALAVEIYVKEFDEPFYSLGTHNMLYEPTTRTLSLVDFTSVGRRELCHFESSHAPLEITLGKCMARLIYNSVRPTTWRNHNYWRRQERLWLTVLARLSTNHYLSRALIQQVSDATYDSLVKKSGYMRWLWYSTVGKALFTHKSQIVQREDCCLWSKERDPT